MIRPAGSQDLPFLRDMLRHAYYARWGNEADVPLERYVAGWGRPGDSAFVAIDEFQPVGAAWYRLFEQDEPGYGFVDERVPELTIAIVPSRRGKGLGRELLAKLLEQAARGRLRGAEPQRRARQPGDPPVRGVRVLEGRRARRRLRDARVASVTGRNDLRFPVRCRAQPAVPRTIPGESSVASAEARSLSSARPAARRTQPGSSSAVNAAPRWARRPTPARGCYPCRRAEDGHRPLRRPRRLHRRIRGPGRGGHP